MDKNNNTNDNDDGNFSKKQSYEQKHAEKEQRREKAIRSRKGKKMMKWSLIVIVLALLIYWGVTAANKSNENRPGEQFPIQNRDHIGTGDSHDPYTTNPPTSGPHSSPVGYGVYTEELPDENLVHNIEHGGIWISYTGIEQDEIDALEEIAKEHPGSVVLTPRVANDSPIAVVSWGRLMKLESVDIEAIEEYIRVNINKSPEPFAL